MVHKQLINAGVPSKLIESIEGQGEVVRSLPETKRVPEDRVVKLVMANRKVISSDLRSINIDSLQKGDAFIIENLHFQPGRHYLLEESIPILKELLKILKDHPELKIELQGHVCYAPDNADGIDLDTQTQDLSVNRAKNIYEYLIRKGINEDRLSYKGFARTRPLYPKERNETEKKLNRRVEILIIDH